jgi:hypothetical protein
MWLVNS